MSSIGSYNFIRMEGSPASPVLATEEITRPNVDGHAFRQVAMRAPMFTLRATVDCDETGDDSPAVLMRGYRGTVGTLQTVTLDTGEVLDDVVIEAMRQTRLVATLLAVGGLSTDRKYLLETEWDCRHTDLTYDLAP